MMKHRLNKAVFPALCLLTALGIIFTGCSTGGDDDDGPAPVAVSGITLSNPWRAANSSIFRGKLFRNEGVSKQL